MSRPLVLAHRGASAAYTENTMAAFAEAVRVGADGVELDVHQCKGGEVVVFHDYDLVRTAGRQQKVKDLTLAELRALRLEGDTRVPTLSEVLGEFPDLLINIEIKTPAVGRAGRLVDATVAVVERFDASDRVLLSSFDPSAILRARRHHSHVRTGYLFHGKQARPLREAWPARVLRPFAVHPEYRLCSKERLARWRRQGYAVNVWTVDEPEQLLRLGGLGVDAVFTNLPERALAVLASGRADRQSN